MEDVKFVLRANKKTIQRFVMLLLIFQTVYIFVFNFFGNLSWLGAARNLFNAVSWAIIVYVPLWAVRRLVNQKEYIPRQPFWFLGVIFNGLLLGVFLPFGLVDFFIKLFIFDAEYISSIRGIIIIGSLFGSIMILIVGGIMATFGAKRKIK